MEQSKYSKLLHLILPPSLPPSLLCCFSHTHPHTNSNFIYRQLLLLTAAVPPPPPPLPLAPPLEEEEEEEKGYS